MAQDRRNIEDRLRNNTIKAIVSTSALELGIDMPDLSYGLHLDLPPSRKQFHQRIGRIGRARPGTFVILAPRNRFSNYGDTLAGYLNNSVEPSNLYLDNEYISHQQALCLKQELTNAAQDTRVPPQTSVWPAHFDKSLRDTHGRTPTHLQSLTGRSADTIPHIAYSLRSTGEETLAIIPLSTGSPPAEQKSIGYIAIRDAIREAYPGAIYHHKGQSYRIEDWARRPSNRQPFLRATPVTNSKERTKPAIRKVASINPVPDNTIADHHTSSQVGSVTELRLTITESVEGFKPPAGASNDTVTSPGRTPVKPEVKGIPHHRRPHNHQPTMVLRGIGRTMAGPTSGSPRPPALPRIPAQHRPLRSERRGRKHHHRPPARPLPPR